MKNKNESHVLIVDDNQNNLQVLGVMLKRNGYKIAAAKSGLEALEYLQKNRPDMILLDIMMPGLDGIETCNKIKEDNKTKNIPIIFITALADTHNKIEAFNSGGVDYITKPFIAEEVMARIDVHISLNKAIEKLNQMSITDELTDLYNRRFAYEVLNKHIANSKRYKELFSICYLDLDNLKLINDTYGHLEGDKYIVMFSNLIRDEIRIPDYLFRMGGDEFLLLLPSTPEEGALTLIDRIKNKISGRQIGEYDAAFSYGIYTIEPDNALDADEILKQVDQKMYEDKKKKK